MSRYYKILPFASLFFILAGYSQLPAYLLHSEANLAFDQKKLIKNSQGKETSRKASRNMETNTSSPLVIAHRGSSTTAPENTLAAFRQAVELNSDYIEMDIHLSKDLVPVVIHDKTLKRTTNAPLFSFFVKNHTLGELQSFDAGSWFAKEFKNENIPSLEEVLQLPKGTTGLMLEIKADHNPELIVENIRRVIEKSTYEEGSIIIGSKSIKIVKELQKQLPYLPTIGIVEKDNIEKMAKLNPPFIALDVDVLRDKGGKIFQGYKPTIWVWTVNTEKDLELCLKEGVQGIITDDPQWAKAALNYDSNTA